MNGTALPSEMNHPPHNDQENQWIIADPVVQDSAYPVDEASPMSEVYHTLPTQEDHYGLEYKTGQKRFSGDPGKAFPVFQRSASDANFGAVTVSLANGGTAIVQGRQKGRTAITLSVPLTFTGISGVTSTPNGVVIATLEGEAQQQGGSSFQLNPGDSITVNTESPIYAGLIPGNTTGVVQWFVEYNPAAGELGNT